MKRISPYLKMRVLGAIEFAPGTSVVARIRHVSEQRFQDEDGGSFEFTWRTIQTWYSRYKKDGVTSMRAKPRSDKGRTRKVEPEQLLEAIEQVRGSFRGTPNVTAIYRKCIEQNLLQRDRVAPNTFRRLVARYELIKPDPDAENKRRLAFAKAHANQLWQADTMFGPHVRHGDGHVQSKLIAFVDDASRVCCHAEFFLVETTETLISALRSALYKRGVPEAMYVDFVPRNKIHVLCPAAICGLSGRDRRKTAGRRRNPPHNVEGQSESSHSISEASVRHGGLRARPFGRTGGAHFVSAAALVRTLISA